MEDGIFPQKRRGERNLETFKFDYMKNSLQQQSSTNTTNTNGNAPSAKGKGKQRRAKQNNSRDKKTLNNQKSQPTNKQEFKPKAQTEKNEKEKETTENEDEEATCLICCNTIRDFKFFSLGKCNHREACSLCSLRLRELYKDKECCICKCVLDVVIFTPDEKTPFESFDLSKLIYDKDLRVYVEGEEHYQNIKHLRDYRCVVCEEMAEVKDGRATTKTASLIPSIPTKPTYSNMNDLKKHLKDNHHFFYCEICLLERKVFLHEHPIYHKERLKKHIEHGDVEDQIKGHPICEFCYTGVGNGNTAVSMPFFSDDQLYEHLERNHFTCFLCEKDGIRFQYYKNYMHVEKHFRNDHFLCEDRICLEKKFVVFRTQLDLKAHEVSVHLHHRNLSKNEEKKSRQVTLDWNYSQASSEPEPNFTPAATRYIMEQENRNTPHTYNQPNVASSNRNVTATLDNKKESKEEENDEEKIEEIKRRNKALVDKMKSLIGEAQYNSFRSLSSSFLKGEISAQEYYERYRILFIDHANEGEKLFNDLISLLPVPEKKMELMHIQRKMKEMDAKFPQLSSTKHTPVPTKGPNFSAVAKAAAPLLVKNNIKTTVAPIQSGRSKEVTIKPKMQTIDPTSIPIHYVEQKVQTVPKEISDLLRSSNTTSSSWGTSNSSKIPINNDFPSLPSKSSKSSRTSKKNQTIIKWG